MKKTTTFSKSLFCIFMNIIIFSSSGLYSQVTLNANNLPHVGDIFINKLILDTTMSAGPSGANVTWNYAAFFINSQTMNEYYVTPSSTPYPTLFPAANMAVNSYFFSSSNGYDFYNVTSNSMQYLGFKDLYNEIVITNAQNMLTVPLQYGQSVTNQPVTGTGLLGATLTGTVSATADSYGTLTLDDGTIYNSLRVVYDFNLTSSFGGPGTETFYHIQKFTWYGGAIRNPELQISILDITGASNSHMKFITRATIPTGIEENGNLFTKFEILNNPVHAELELNIQMKRSANVKLEIIDVVGKTWKNENVQSEKLNHPVKIDVADLPCGIYFVSVSAMGSKQQQRVVVE
jgi:Secretion system C-terminal sorting domain